METDVIRDMLTCSRRAWIMAESQGLVELANTLATKEMVREISRNRHNIEAAKARVEKLRDARDAQIAYCHQAGVSASALAQDAGLTRQGIYDAIRRHRKESRDG